MKLGVYFIWCSKLKRKTKRHLLVGGILWQFLDVLCPSNMGIPAGDPEKGKKIFMQRCAHCHTIDAGGKQLHSPNLHGIVGRKSGSSPGYNNYTEANKSISGLWYISAIKIVFHQYDTLHVSVACMLPSVSALWPRHQIQGGSKK